MLEGQRLIRRHAHEGFLTRRLSHGSGGCSLPESCARERRLWPACILRAMLCSFLPRRLSHGSGGRSRPESCAPERRPWPACILRAMLCRFLPQRLSHGSGHFPSRKIRKCVD
jgi:hypothetical protein